MNLLQINYELLRELNFELNGCHFFEVAADISSYTSVYSMSIKDKHYNHVLVMMPLIVFFMFMSSCSQVPKLCSKLLYEITHVISHRLDILDPSSGAHVMIEMMDVISRSCHDI